jgi:hypothetical protein
LSSDVPTIFFITSSLRPRPEHGRLRSAGALGVSLGKALRLGNLPSSWDGFRRPAALGFRVLLPSPPARRSRVARAGARRRLGDRRVLLGSINKRAYGRGLRRYGCTTLSLPESHLARSSAALPLAISVSYSFSAEAGTTTISSGARRSLTMAARRARPRSIAAARSNCSVPRSQAAS